MSETLTETTIASEAEILARAQAGEPLTDEERAVLRARARQTGFREPTKLDEHQADAVRLDLGSGETPAAGFEGVDLFAPGARHRVDLMAFPWPWADGSVDELHCSHFIEHLPMVFVERGCAQAHAMPGPGRVDLLLAFFNECHRILKPGGCMKLVWPALQNVRAFMDPTHRRFIPIEFSYYLSRSWREVNKLDHYLGATCNFDCNGGPTVQDHEARRAPEVQQQRTVTLWGVAQDWVATLKKLP